MSVSAIPRMQYTVMCDVCDNQEEYLYGDTVRGVHIHSIHTAVTASGYKPSQMHNGKLLCPECQAKEEKRIAGGGDG